MDDKKQKKDIDADENNEESLVNDNKGQRSDDSKRIKELEKKILELEDQLKRAVADYRNFQKRVEEDRKELIQFANKDFLLKLFPAFDILLLAEKHIEDEGLRLSVKKIREVLKSVGVMQHESQGETFDPEYMECVETREGEDNIVLEEIRPGFSMNGKILRPALVVVGKKQEESMK